MRLLHSSRLEIELFMADEDIPPYAILSHTWGEEEISFQEWKELSSFDINLKKGYFKIKQCCEQAQHDGLEWAWIDTCCIDKTSSAELSEAINSMFRYYEKAAVCYAYLSDVPSCVDVSVIENNLARSRWFTRGWTLQELIAPTNIVFYSIDWHPLGTKSQLHSILTSITGIQKNYLLNENLESASIARKMSWAASRRTTRIEDIAYSLLGIFDINMPLIYGEGKKAFRRLQEELLKSHTDDHSLFAWGTIVSTPSIKITDTSLIMGHETIQRGQNEIHQPLLGLLAESPRDFSGSGSFVPSQYTGVFYRSSGRTASLPLIIDRGVRLELPLIEAFDSIYYWERPMITQIRTAKIVVLLCSHEDKLDSFVMVPIQRWGVEYFGRTRELLLENNSIGFIISGLLDIISMITIAPERKRNLRSGDLIIRRHAFPDSNHCAASRFAVSRAAMNDDGVIESLKLTPGQSFAYIYEMDDLSPMHGFAIQLSRGAEPGKLGDSLLVELFPCIFEDEELDQHENGPSKSKFEDYGLKWWPSESANWQKPIHLHAMKPPSDIWYLDAEPFPYIFVRVDRMLFDEDDSFVEVVDVVIHSRKGARTDLRKLHSWSR